MRRPFSARSWPLVFVALWFAAWVSPPGSEAVQSYSQLTGYAGVKVAVRAAIMTLGAVAVLRHLSSFQRSLSGELLLPVAYFTWNLSLSLVLSSEKFYSTYRILEMALVWISAYVVLLPSSRNTGRARQLWLFFSALAVACAALILLYFVAPEWGAKSAGFDSLGRMSTRLGGSALRVDLAASLGGCVFLFFLLADGEGGRAVRARWLGIGAGGLVLLLAHSRTALLLALFLALASILSRRSRQKGALIWSATVLSAVLAAETVLAFLLRGAASPEILELNGRMFLWRAVFSENTPLTVLLGNGYMMNTPGGLSFFVPEMGRFMDSPHSGYVSVLLGGGLISAVLVISMYVVFYRSSRLLARLYRPPHGDSAKFVLLFLILSTFMDFGIWGVTSPSTLIFAVVFLYIVGRARPAARRGRASVTASLEGPHAFAQRTP